MSMSLYDAVMIVEGAREADGTEFIDACQELIDSGAYWVLPGHIGRVCQAMVEAELCRAPVVEERESVGSG